MPPSEADLILELSEQMNDNEFVYEHPDRYGMRPGGEDV